MAFGIESCDVGGARVTIISIGWMLFQIVEQVYQFQNAAAEPNDIRVIGEEQQLSKGCHLLHIQQQYSQV